MTGVSRRPTLWARTALVLGLGAAVLYTSAGAAAATSTEGPPSSPRHLSGVASPLIPQPLLDTFCDLWAGATAGLQRPAPPAEFRACANGWQ
ncbi:hypothetical protein [Streptomyces sp. NPDC051776]|uniref:hypothetical protein n=1 Tax=Streptomyces sp. NPDC051776 TaxID=3155414 RepID=UPI0034218570